MSESRGHVAPDGTGGPAGYVPALGMDHDLYDWDPLPRRQPWRWLDGSHIAVCLLVCLSRYPLVAPEGAYESPEVPGSRGKTPFPDVVSMSTREYGLRVGMFRVQRVAERHGVPVTVAIDASVADRCPTVVDQCADWGWEIIAHGRSSRELVTSRMTVDAERDYIERSISDVARRSGRRALGWLSPEGSESARTPHLLREAGIQYLLDWPNDEQPYWMRTTAGSLVSLPLMIELDDVVAHWQRKVPIWRWEHMVTDAFDTLDGDGAETGARVLTLPIHPWLMGRPYCIQSLDHALRYLTGQDGVWAARAGEIADAFRQTRPA